MKKKKYVSILNKAIAIAAIGGIVATGAFFIRKGIVRLFDKNINHLEEYCPYNEVLGINHQIKKINEIEGYKATLKENGEIEIIAQAQIEESNGNKYYIVPDDYILKGSYGVKTLKK